MIEKIIHFTVPAQRSARQAQLIERAADLHPRWQIRVWEDPVSPADLLLGRYHPRVNAGAQLADLIRLDAIYEFGGIYIDSDIELFRPLDALLPLDHFFCSEDGFALTNAAFGASRHHSLIKALISNLLEFEPDWHRKPNESTGPEFFSKVLRSQTDLSVLPRDTFYPYNWNEAPRPPLTTTIGVHEWSGSWTSQESTVAKARKSIVRRNTPRRVLRRLAVPVNERLSQELTSAASVRSRAVGFNQDMIVEMHCGLLLSASGSDPQLLARMMFEPDFMKFEIDFLEATLRGGDFYVDAHAGSGLFSMVAARRVGPFGRVFAFERDPCKRPHLIRSALINAWENRVLVSEEFGAALIAEEVPPGDDRGLRDQGLRHIAGARLEIKVLRIDSCDLGIRGTVEALYPILLSRAVGNILIHVDGNELQPEVIRTALDLNRLLQQEYRCHRLLADGTTAKAEASEIQSFDGSFVWIRSDEIPHRLSSA